MRTRLSADVFGNAVDVCGDGLELDDFEAGVRYFS
jgi:hypothetical protein